MKPDNTNPEPSAQIALPVRPHNYPHAFLEDANQRTIATFETHKERDYVMGIINSHAALVAALKETRDKWSAEYTQYHEEWRTAKTEKERLEVADQSFITGKFVEDIDKLITLLDATSQAGESK